MKSAAGRFWQSRTVLVTSPKIGFYINSIHLRVSERKTAVQIRANKKCSERTEERI